MDIFVREAVAGAATTGVWGGNCGSLSAGFIHGMCALL